MPSRIPPVVSELLSHRTVRIALIIVAVILVGSITYYLIESAPPALTYAAASDGPISETITGSGTVSPLQNPDLSFAAAGRVTSVTAKVGQKVSAGSVLATLDTGVLAANLAAAQAKLDELVAGPRSVDVAGQQTSLESAQASLPDTLRNTEAQAETAVAATDPLFTSANTNPQLASLLVSDLDTKQHIEAERRALNTELSEWRTEAGANPSVASTLAHLRSVSTYLTDLSDIVSTTKADTSADETTLAGYTADVNGARTSVSSLTLGVTKAETAVQSAQDQLSLTQAGARPEDIDAQRAQVASIAAQLRQEEVIAPFAGTVAAVDVKSGDVVAANTTAVSLVPDGAFEVEIYVSEVEMTKLNEGDAATITLDAYGANRAFPGTVALVDRAPSAPDAKTAPGYKVTIAFTNADPAVTVGMHANVAISGGQKADALIVPRAAIIEDGTQTYVLKKGPNGPVKTPVSVGLINSDSAEIISGLAAGDLVARAGTH